MGPIWGRQDPGGPHVGPMNLAIWVTHRQPIGICSLDKWSGTGNILQSLLNNSMGMKNSLHLTNAIFN